MQYRHVQIIGGKGNAPDRFTATLHGVAVDSLGQLYAAGDSEIKVFDSAGQLKKRWPTSRPVLSVAVAGDGAVYTGQPGQIEVFDGAGKLLQAWKNDRLLGHVTAIGFTKDSVLAGDAGDRAIRRFDRYGKFLNNIGKNNPVNGLLIPNGVVDFSVGSNDIVYAANPGKHRVEMYAPGGDLLGHIGKFDGIDPAGFGGCCNPTNVAVRGSIFTTEKASPRVKAFDFAGNLQVVIATGLFDANCKNMSIAVDARGRVYVADTVKLAIFVFEPENAL